MNLYSFCDRLTTKYELVPLLTEAKAIFFQNFMGLILTFCGVGKQMYKDKNVKILIKFLGQK